MSMAWTLAVSVTMAAALTGMFIPTLRRAHFWDVPNHRSSHTQPALRGGGVPVMATLLAILLTWNFDSIRLLGPVLVMSLVGFVDDWKPIDSRIRLMAQFAVGATLCLLMLLSDSPPAIFGLEVLFVVSCINAFNFMDGVNCISSVTAAIAGVWYMWVGLQFEVPLLPTVSIVMAGAVLGFLPFNFRGRLFLGDVGSYGLGCLLAALALQAYRYGATPLVAIAPLIIYFTDTGQAILTRLLRGKKLGEAHRQHIYQKLADSRLSHIGVTAATAIFTTIICCTVYCLEVLNLATPIPVLLIIATAAIYIVSPRIYISVGRAQRELLG